MDLDKLLEFSRMERNQPHIVFCMNLTSDDISTVRKTFRIHPVVDSECTDSVFNVKDQVLDFGSYFVLTLSDLNKANELESSFSFKVVCFQELMLIFAASPLYCLDKVSKEEGYTLLRSYEQESINISNEVEMIMGNKKTTRVKIDIGNEQGCTEIEAFLHKLIDSSLFRLEHFILNLDKESQACINYSIDLNVSERVEFIQKISLTEKHLIYLRDLIKPKKKLFMKLKNMSLFSEDIKYYIDSMTSRCAAIYQRIQTSAHMLKTAEHIYEASVEETLTNQSNKLNAVMKHFSSIATIFLPLNLITGLFGMNVKIPMGEVDSFLAFSTVVGACISIFFFIILYFKNKNFL